jgi:hypothetical protein
MHEFTFADVVCPDTPTVLGLPLIDFSLGHRLILLRQRNPLVWMAEADYNALEFAEQIKWLKAAVNVCSLPMFPDWRTRLAWHWRNWRATRARKRFTPADWALETAKFRIYLDQARIITEFSERREGFPFMPTMPMPEASGRSLGGPYDAALLQFLVREFRLDLREALQFPLAQAQIHFLTWLEREGHLRVMNAFETEFEEESARLDLASAKAAGFENVDDYKADCLKKARAAKETAEATQPTS